MARPRRIINKETPSAIHANRSRTPILGEITSTIYINKQEHSRKNKEINSKILKRTTFQANFRRKYPQGCLSTFRSSKHQEISSNFFHYPIFTFRYRIYRPYRTVTLQIQ